MIERLFLSVGAMKAGTTWLRQQLASHPDMAMTPEKEIHYFAAPDGRTAPMRLEDRLARFQRVVGNIRPEAVNDRVRQNLGWYIQRYLADKIGPAWYAELFGSEAGGRYCADFSNLYCLLDSERWAHVRAVSGHIRAVYTLRHPLERLWSHVRFHFQFAGKEERFEDWTRSGFAAFFAQPSVAPHGAYATNLTRLRQHLAEDELKLMFFEDQRADPLGFLREVEGLLDIRAHAYKTDSLSKPVNPSAQADMPRALRDFGLSFHRAEVAALDTLGVALPENWDKV